MAERTRLSLPTGQRHSHRLSWADADDPEGSRSRLGRLEWSVVVLEELTVDLQVSVELRPRDQEAPGLVLLQESTRGRSFNGSFDPATDPRLAGPEDGGLEGEDAAEEGAARSEVEAVIFEFSNAFSWWTDKEIELIVLRVRPSGPPASKVPPLQPLQPYAPLPRGSAPADDALAAQAAPELRAASAEAEASEEAEVRRFAAHVDACLAAAEERCAGSEGGAWLSELQARLLALRGFCQLGPPRPAAAATGEVASEEAAEAETEEHPANGAPAAQDAAEADADAAAAPAAEEEPGLGGEAD